jgi:FRG domain
MAPLRRFVVGVKLMAKKILPARVSARLAARREALSVWHDFMDWVSQHPSPRWVFRGHGQDWPLKPTIGRNSNRYKPDSEAKLLSEFKRLAPPYLEQANAMTEWDWLFIAQHHGLPTRLLDWTVNPLVAAHFACAPSIRGKKDGTIIAIETRHSGLIDPRETPDPLSIGRTAFVYPSSVASRIVAQRGLFSVHAAPTIAWRVPKQREDFTMPANVKSEFHRLLMEFGIDAHLLMADLDGLTSTLKTKYDLGIAFS